jgi:hypothetical protein
MKTLNRKPLVVLLALAMIGALAVSGCKKKAPSVAPPPTDTSTSATAPDASTPAAATPAPAAAPTPAPAPADSATAGGPVSVPLKDPNAFQSSDPKLQDLWNTAIAAAQTNGWATTYNSLMAIRRSPSLSSSQGTFIDTSINTVGLAMYNAAQNGDQAAAAGLAQVRRRHHQSDSAPQQ